jgi:hypothetical protein|tara:strand:- start:219 stop:596 length:378 start_codon:yes stop_codon:yes gene_type:complete
MNILSAILGPVGNVATTYLKNKAEEKQAKHEAKMSVIQSDANWEATMAESTKDSWKDEFWTLVLAVPIFMVGYAIAVDDITVIDRVEKAFLALENLPEWYQYLLFICISSSFGIRGVSKIMNLKK